MTELLIPLLLALLAGLANGAQDKVWHHFKRSVFYRKNPEWWDGQESHKYNDDYPKWLVWAGFDFSDALHTFKSIMLWLLSFAIGWHYEGWDILWVTLLFRFAFGVGFWITWNGLEKK